MLYDETDRRNAAKLNRCISDNFDGVLTSVPASLAEFANTARLADMLDFSRVAFEKQITLAPQANNHVRNSKYPLAKLGEVASVLIGGTPPRSIPSYFTGSNPWVSIGEMSGNVISNTKEKITDAAIAASNVKLIPKGTTLLSFKLSIGKTAIAGCDLYTNEAIAGLIPKDRKVLTDSFLFHLFNAKHIDLEGSGYKAFGKSLNSNFLKEDVRIPLPPPDVQQKVVAECGTIDKEIIAANASITAAQAKITAQMEAIYVSKVPRVAIKSLALNVQYGLSEKMNEAGVGYKIFRMNEIADGRMVDGGAMKRADISAEEFAKYKLNRGDVLFNRTNSIEHVGKTGLFDLDGDYCFASYLVRVVPDTKQVLPLFLAQMMNSPAFQKEAKSKAAKAINQANINATVMKNIKVPLPSPAKQQAFVAAVLEQERVIAEARAVVAGAPARKQAIMSKYL